MKYEYIKSPLNYTGGKYKILDQIIPKFPEKIDTFVDLFGGGFNVGINVKANHIIYNEINNNLVELMKIFKINDINKNLNDIYRIIDKYKLSKENQEGFNNLRKDYKII